MQLKQRLKQNLKKLKNWISSQLGREVDIDSIGLILNYKGTSTVDAAAFYCPYIPLQSISISNTSVVYSPTGQTFTLQEILEKHARDNQ